MTTPLQPIPNPENSRILFNPAVPGLGVVSSLSPSEIFNSSALNFAGQSMLGTDYPTAQIRIGGQESLSSVSQSQQISDLHLKYADVYSKYSKLEQRHNELEGQYNTLSQKYEEEFNNYKDELTSLKSSQETSVEVLQEKLETQKTDLGTLDKKRLQLERKVDSANLRSIEILSIFVALFTFISGDFQLFKQEDLSIIQVASLIGILGAFLLLFILVIHCLILSWVNIVGEENNLPLKKMEKWMFGVTILVLILSGVGLVYGEKQVNSDADPLTQEQDQEVTEQSSPPSLIEETQETTQTIPEVTPPVQGSNED